MEPPGAVRAKAATYAAAGVPVYWLVDVAARRVEVHEAPLPAEGRYGLVRLAGESEALDVPRTDVAVRIADFLPTVG